MTTHEKTILREWRRLSYVAPVRAHASRAPASLNATQSEAASRHRRSADGRYAPFLLHGVTGSGKTEVYLAAADAVFAQRRPGADARARDQPDAAARRARARGAAAGCASRCCTARSPPASAARTGCGRDRRRAARAGHAPRGLRAAAGARARRRRRRAGRVVQAAGQRALSRARCRDLARAPARRPRRARQRDAVARNLARGARGALSQARSSATRGSARRAPAGAPLTGTARRVAHDGIGEALRVGHRGAPRPRRAIAGLRQSPRLCPVADLRRRASGTRSARAAARGSPTHRAPPSLRCHHCGHVERACRAHVPRAATSTWCRSGFGTQRLERALVAAFPARAHRACRSRQHAREARLQRACATRWRRTRSTSWSARRCSRRATIFRA